MLDELKKYTQQLGLMFTIRYVVEHDKFYVIVHLDNPIVKSVDATDGDLNVAITEVIGLAKRTRSY